MLPGGHAAYQHFFSHRKGHWEVNLRAKCMKDGYQRQNLISFSRSVNKWINGSYCPWDLFSESLRGMWKGNEPWAWGVQLLGWGSMSEVWSRIGDLLLFSVGCGAFRCTSALRFRDYITIQNELVDYILLRLARAAQTCSDLTPSNKH